MNLFFILRDPEGGPEGGPDEGGTAFVPSPQLWKAIVDKSSREIFFWSRIFLYCREYFYTVENIFIQSRLFFYRRELFFTVEIIFCSREIFHSRDYFLQSRIFFYSREHFYTREYFLQSRIFTPQIFPAFSVESDRATWHREKAILVNMVQKRFFRKYLAALGSCPMPWRVLRYLPIILAVLGQATHGGE